MQDDKLIKNRVYSSCALIKGKDGLRVVAIVGAAMKKVLNCGIHKLKKLQNLPKWVDQPPMNGLK